MKLDELEQNYGNKTAPIPDTCQPVKPPVALLPAACQTTIDKIMEGKEENLCKVTRFRANPKSPTGWDEEVKWVRTDDIPTLPKSKVSKHEYHLGGVEGDALDMEYDPVFDRWAYPYSEGFSKFD